MVPFRVSAIRNRSHGLQRRLWGVSSKRIGDSTNLEALSYGMTIPVSCDFNSDLRRVLLTKLDKLGYSIGNETNADAVLVSFLNVCMLRIWPHPRSVRWSSSLESRKQALPSDLLRPIEKIAEASVRGADLNSYLSRALVRDKKVAAIDFQFNDWGMKHLHLGESFESPGVIKGTPELLFIIERPTTIYFIEVGTHKDWAKQELFEIVVREWPELFECWRFRGVTGLEYGNPTAGLRKKLRSAKITTPTQTSDGAVYSATGGGQLTNGCNLHVRIKADSMLERINALEEAYRGNGSKIASLIAEKTGQTVAELCLELVDLDNFEPVIIEIQTGIRLC